MEFHPSKGYSWKTSTAATAKTATPAKSVLRAQETQVFRHWMDRAIEASSLKVIQARQAIDTPEADKTNATTGLDSPSSQRGNCYYEHRNIILTHNSC